MVYARCLGGRRRVLTVDSGNLRLPESATATFSFPFRMRGAFRLAVSTPTPAAHVFPTVRAFYRTPVLLLPAPAHLRVSRTWGSFATTLRPPAAAFAPRAVPTSLSGNRPSFSFGGRSLSPRFGRGVGFPLLALWGGRCPRTGGHMVSIILQLWASPYVSGV